MAISTKDQQKILRTLGWAGLTIVADSTHFNSVVNDRLGNNVQKPLTSEIEREVKGLLERICRIEDSLDEAICRLSAKSVDKLVMNPDEIPMLKRELRRWARELSDLLDIPMMKSSGMSISVVS